jgi:serine/threonine protein kinase
MEFCANGSLADRGKEPWGPRDAARLVATLAGAVNHAHAQHVIHRDLKPANILFAADASPKIADFGLAKRLDAEPLTQSHAVMGSPGFMAPEQASGGSKRVGPPADVYGLGAILYHLLAGRPPFKGSDPMEVLLQVAQNPPPPIRKQRPEVPADLEAVCLKCLEKEPEKRYASAEALKADLERFLAGEAVEVRPRRKQRSSRQMRIAQLLAVVGIGIAAFFIPAIPAVQHWLRTKFSGSTEQTQFRPPIKRQSNPAHNTPTDSEKPKTPLARLQEAVCQQNPTWNQILQLCNEVDQNDKANGPYSAVARIEAEHCRVVRKLSSAKRAEFLAKL